MAQVGNSAERFGGEFMIQDRDHMGDTNPATEKASRGNTRQAEQSQAGDRQHGGGDHGGSTQQGGERRR